MPPIRGMDPGNTTVHGELTGICAASVGMSHVESPPNGAWFALGESMTAKNRAGRPAKDEWAAELLRFTLFGAVGTCEPAASWWADLAGAEPEATVRKGPTREYQAEGAFAGGRLFLKVNALANRVDWLHTAAQQTMEAFDTVGPFD